MNTPIAPDSIPKHVQDSLERQDIETLREIEVYASELIDHRQQQELEIEDDEEDDELQLDDDGDELPDDVPSRATLTVKTINENRYYYYQWSQDGKTKSKYKCPVSSG